MYKTNKKTIYNLIFIFIAFTIISSLIFIFFQGFKDVKANTNEENIECVLPLEDCVQYIDEDAQDGNTIVLKNNVNPLDEESANTTKDTSNFFGSYLTLNANIVDNQAEFEFPYVDECEWECYPMNEDCYTHYDESGEPDEFQLLVHTSAGDAVGIAQCKNPGLCEPGRYDIRGKRGEYCLPGDSRGICDILYQYTSDGYYYWSVTNQVTKTSYRYQTWVGMFRAPAYGDCLLEKYTDCPWSENNINYCYGGDGTDCVHYDIFTDPQCSQFTGKYINLDRKDGSYSLGYSPKLQCGTYYIQESKTCHGNNYLWNSEIASVQINADETSYVVFNNTGDYHTFDTPLYDSNMISIAKSDYDTGESGITLGSPISFEGAIYEFDYSQDYYDDHVDYYALDSFFEKKWYMRTDQYGCVAISDKYKSNKADGDDFFYDKNGNIVCPLGTYFVHEISAPEGYLLSDIIYSIELKADVSDSTKIITNVKDITNSKTLNQIIDQHTGDNSVQLTEQVIRGDYKLVKTNQDMREMAGIPFKITSINTGEWHIYVTDSNGCIDTSSINFSHCNKTNCNDLLYDEETNQIIDETKLDSACGCWFCLDKKTGVVSEPRDDCGCFPYDTYTVEEIETSKNYLYAPFGKKTFTVSKEKYFIDGGTWINSRDDAFLLSEASADKSGHELAASDKEIVKDEIYYKGLLDKKEYVIKAWLVNKSNEEILEFIDQKGDSKEQENDIDKDILANDDKENDDIDVEISDNKYIIKKFAADSNKLQLNIDGVIDTTNLKGETLVWFCELYDTNMNELLYEHKNIDNTNESLYVKSDVEEKPTITPLIDTPKTDDLNYRNVLIFLAVVVSVLAIFITRKFVFAYIENKKYPGINKKIYKKYKLLFCN